VKHLIRVLLSAVLLFMPLLCLAEASTTQYGDLVGHYECIGRWPDSNHTYAGRVEVSKAPQGITITRTIDGQQIEASGKFGTATPDASRVLRVTFIQNGERYEQTCLVSADLDNYARITCYLYSNKTTKVGLESWFPDHGQLRRNGCQTNILF